MRGFYNMFNIALLLKSLILYSYKYKNVYKLYKVVLLIIQVL